MLAFWLVFSGFIVGFVLGEIVGASWTMHRYRTLFKRESVAKDRVMKQIFDSGVAVGRHEHNIGRVHGFGASPRDDEPKPD